VKTELYRRHYRNFDILRFAAAMWVVCYHYGYQGWHLGRITNHLEPGLPGQVAFLGFLRVTVFFGISGYFLVEVSKGRTWQKLLMARVLRIAPAFWIALTVSAISLILLGSTQTPTIPQWLANFTLLPQIFGLEFVDGAYWSLVYEVVFYCWVVLLVGLGVFHRHLLVITMIWLLISMTNLIWFENSAIERVLITTHSTGFIFGMLLSHIRTHGRNWANVTVLIIAMFVMVPAIEHFAGGPASPEYFLSQSHLINFLFPVFMFALLSACIYLPDIPISNSMALYLGGLSYPLYLVHQEIGYALIGTRPETVPELVWIALATAIVFCLASLVYRLEVPARKYLAGMIARYGNRSPTTMPAE
jgi:peptidoglycan/LPS O-acetylase OafA/YrhL